MIHFDLLLCSSAHPTGSEKTVWAVGRMGSLSTITLTSLLFITITCMPPAVQGAGRYGKMAESMMDMMDVFASAYQKRRGDGQSRNFSDITDYNWMPGLTWPPGNVPMPGSRLGNPRKIPGLSGQIYRSRLDGNWQGRTGEILAIRSGRFRIYQSPERYHEGLIYFDEKHLALRQAKAGVTHQYEYAEEGGRLVLRDTQGNLLLYRKIR